MVEEKALRKAARKAELENKTGKKTRGPGRKNRLTETGKNRVAVVSRQDAAGVGAAAGARGRARPTPPPQLPATGASGGGHSLAESDDAGWEQRGELQADQVASSEHLELDFEALAAAGGGLAQVDEFSPQHLEGGLDALQQQLLARPDAEQLARQHRQQMYLLRTAMMVGGQELYHQTNGNLVQGEDEDEAPLPVVEDMDMPSSPAKARQPAAAAAQAQRGQEREQPAEAATALPKVVLRQPQAVATGTLDGSIRLAASLLAASDVDVDEEVMPDSSDDDDDDDESRAVPGSLQQLQGQAEGQEQGRDGSMGSIMNGGGGAGAGVPGSQEEDEREQPAAAAAALPRVAPGKTARTFVSI